MIAEATRYEKFLEARGAGAFGKVEYESATKITLRTAEVKTADLSGTVRVYFNSKREQVISGRRFDPMGSGLLLLRPGMFYRVYTTLQIVKPLPKSISALVTLNDDAADVMMVTTAPFQEGYVGPVTFTIQPFRKIELEKMTSIATLVFFEEMIGLSKDWMEEEWVESVKNTLVVAVMKALKEGPKSGNSDRTKKSTKTTRAKKPMAKKAKKTEGAPDANILSDEHSDNPES